MPGCTQGECTHYHFYVSETASFRLATQPASPLRSRWRLLLSQNVESSVVSDCREDTEPQSEALVDCWLRLSSVTPAEIQQRHLLTDGMVVSHVKVSSSSCLTVNCTVSTSDDTRKMSTLRTGSSFGRQPSACKTSKPPSCLLSSACQPVSSLAILTHSSLHSAFRKQPHKHQY